MSDTFKALLSRAIYIVLVLQYFHDYTERLWNDWKCLFFYWLEDATVASSQMNPLVLSSVSTAANPIEQPLSFKFNSAA